MMRENMRTTAIVVVVVLLLHTVCSVSPGTINCYYYYCYYSRPIYAYPTWELAL